MSNTPPEKLYGATCLPDLANYLKMPLSKQQTIDAVTAQNTQYVLVHMYLIPGVPPEHRLTLRNSIRSELAKHNGIQLHDGAFAVPACQGDGRNIAEQVWESLMFAGVVHDSSEALDMWETGDVIYVHYIAHDGIGTLAAAPSTGTRLPDARER
jgi:hypothetical protein